MNCKLYRFHYRAVAAVDPTTQFASFYLKRKETVTR